MSKVIPKISKYMTTSPDAINFDSTIVEAMNVMEKHNIRHLPVIKNNSVFGLLSDRDVKSILAFAGTNPKTIKVGEICTDKPFITKPEALLTDVVAEMASQKFGSALVVDNGKLVGIFTTTNVCEALTDICNQRFHA